MDTFNADEVVQLALESDQNKVGNNLYLPFGPPSNESEVEYLFKNMAGHHFGFSRIEIRKKFPDCLAWKGKKLLRIEFEFKSKNFQIHGHDPSQCDWIVCWRDTWGEEAPASLKIVELRRLFRLPFNVWFQPLNKYAGQIGHINVDEKWSVASKASEGDLLLVYLCKPQMCVRDLFIIDGPVVRVEAGWKAGYDYMAPIKREATLNVPLTWEEMMADERLSQAGFLHGAMAGRPRVSGYWSVLLEMIVEANPELVEWAERFWPENIPQWG
jgi:hypothetical protein